MARDIIDVQNPVLDNSESVGTVKVTKTTVTQANGITVKKAFNNKNNTLFIHVDTTVTSDSSLTVKAGDAYPNAMLGDLTVALTKSAETVLQIQDPSRFENKDGSVNIDFASGFVGTIYAVAKRAGLKPVA
nr:MAG TPA: hypothetical protein [Caudoviricetes sp.]